MKEDVYAIPVVAGMYLGGPRPEYYREKLGSAAKEARINDSPGAEAPTIISQVE